MVSVDQHAGHSAPGSDTSRRQPEHAGGNRMRPGIRANAAAPDLKLARQSIIWTSEGHPPDA